MNIIELINAGNLSIWLCSSVALRYTNAALLYTLNSNKTYCLLKYKDMDYKMIMRLLILKLLFLLFIKLLNRVTKVANLFSIFLSHFYYSY